MKTEFKIEGIKCHIAGGMFQWTCHVLKDGQAIGTTCAGHPDEDRAEALRKMLELARTDILSRS